MIDNVQKQSTHVHARTHKHAHVHNASPSIVFVHQHVQTTPSNMPNARMTLAASGKVEKLPAGPMVGPSAGPTLVSAVAAPDGTWLLEPVVGEECVRTVTLDRARVLEERQNFDPVGHYSRPDCLRLLVDRRRQTSVEWRD